VLQRELEAARGRAERRRLEALLYDEQERYRSTFEQAPLGITYADRDGRFISVNERYAALVGYPVEEIVGRHFYDFAHPEESAFTREDFQELLASTRSTARYERRYRRRDGSEAWATVTLAIIRDTDGTARYGVGMVEDITSQKKSHAKIQMQSRLLECVDQAVIATDLSGRVIYWNGFAEKMYGWTAEETCGRNILEFTPAPESQPEAAAILERLMRGESWAGEMLLTRRDGTVFPALVVDSPMLADDGTMIGVVGVSHDLTAQKDVANELRAHKLQLAEAQELARIGSWTYDFATGQRQWSDAMCRLYGFAPGTEPSMKDAFAAIHPDDRQRMLELQEHAHRTLEPVSAEFRIVRNGVERIMVTRVQFLFDENGRPTKALGVLQDVTSSKLREDELRRRTIQQSAIANLGRIALSGASIEFLLEQAAISVQTVLEMELSNVLQKEEGSFRVRAGVGWVTLDQLIPAEETPLALRTIIAGEALIMHDSRSESRFKLPARLLDAGVTSGATVPIHSADGETWGVLATYACKPREYASYDIEFLRSVATVLGQAIDRSRADAELRTRARQQSAIAELGRLVLTSVDHDVFEHACELLTQAIGAEYAFMTELTPSHTLRLRAGHIWANDLPHELSVAPHTQAGYTLLHGEPTLVDDYATETRFDVREATVRFGIRSGLMVPIASAHQTFGVLSAQSSQPRHFRREDVEFVQALANMLAEAMERELARHVIEESEHRYRRIFDGASEIIFTVDTEGRFVALNPAFETITGWSRTEWLGRPFIELIAPEDRERVYAIFEGMLRDSSSAGAEMSLLGRDRIVRVDVASFPTAEDGAISEVYGFARDITETRRATAERERVTRSMQLLLESTVEGVFTLDLDGRCTIVNRSAAAMLQRSPEELLGQPMHELVHGCTALEACAVHEVITTGAAQSVTSDSFVRRDGSQLPVAYSAAPIIDNGAAVGVVVTFTDLTERRKLEAKLEQANRLSSLGRLAATVAHEFNNVLMGIAPFVEVVRRNPSPQKVSTSLDHIANSVKRGRRITQDILRFTQPAEPVRARVDTDAWLRGVAIEARSVLSTLYTVNVEAERLWVEADATQLHQIFMNLVFNARDAMPGGGTISIRARREPRDARFSFGAVDDPSRYVHFTVSDTGCGMPVDTLHHAFEPLFTTKKNGTGLGLAVTHQVVLRHGGEIFIESEVGAGTTFHIFLPLAPQSEATAIPDAAGEQPHERPVKRILLVEDDSAVALGLTSLLEFEGFVVANADTGADALLKVRANKFDAVLLDVGLPDMDGQAVYSRIAALQPSLPVIFSTGHADRGSLEEMLARPNVSYLLKPYEADALMETLARVMAAQVA
nr:PAS domain S-box protein [Acidobacteriota bacterium]